MRWVNVSAQVPANVRPRAFRAALVIRRLQEMLKPRAMHASPLRPNRFRDEPMDLAMSLVRVSWPVWFRFRDAGDPMVRWYLNSGDGCGHWRVPGRVRCCRLNSFGANRVAPPGRDRRR